MRVRKLLSTLCIAVHLSTLSKAALAAGTGAAAAITSAALGFDPLAWGIGGLGGTFIYLRGAPAARSEVIANIILSILLGGIASPVCYAAVAVWKPEFRDVPGQYLIALLLCFGWPQLSRAAMAIVMRRYGTAQQ